MKRITSAAQFGKVAVLYGGDSAEREVSLDSGAAVLEALRAKGVDAFGFDPAEAPLGELSGRGVTRAWNALHGGAGEGGAVQGALECLGIAYTGSGVLGSALALDKVRSKMLFASIGLQTPYWRTVRCEADLEKARDAVGLPCFVKPAADGSSVGVTRVEEPDQLRAAWEQARAVDPVVIVEQLVDGPEYTAGILAGEVLPLIRIEAAETFYDYEAKYVSDATRYDCPCGLAAEQEQLLAGQCLAAFEVLALSGWGRVDFMLDADGVAQFLEVNTIPGMTSHSLVPKAAAAVGIDFPSLVWRVLETSFTEDERT